MMRSTDCCTGTTPASMVSSAWSGYSYGCDTPVRGMSPFFAFWYSPLTSRAVHSSTLVDTWTRKKPPPVDSTNSRDA
jgi:hypothetical protein